MSTLAELTHRERLGDVALAYAAHPWAVFPLRPRHKEPLISKADGGRGCHDATTDPEQVTKWWAAHPWANIGIAAGPAFWVLDVDYLGWEATKPDGADTIAALQKQFGRLPPTVTSLTGGGGWQQFFKPDERLRNGVNALPGLDVRTHGGYIVAAPSVHPDTRRAYRWRRDHGPGELEIATAPEWLIALLEPVELPQPEPTASAKVGDLGRYAAAALDRAADAIQRAAIGEQNDVLDHQAYGIGRLVAGGVIADGIARSTLISAGCRMANAPRRRPWTNAEITKRIDRAFAQAAHAPRSPEPRQ